MYLAQYLLKLEIPEDVIAQDDNLQRMYQEYIPLLEDFKQTHREYTRQTQGLEDPQPLQDKLDKLTEQSETLDRQIEETENKIQNIVCFI